MASSKYVIRGDNPKGLPYAWATNDAGQAMNWVRELILKGAINIKVNGNLVPQELIDTIS